MKQRPDSNPESKAKVVAYVPESAHRELKKLAIDERLTMSEMVANALQKHYPQAFRG